MVMAVICLLLVTTICFSLARFAVAAQQQAERRGWGVQSEWLAESALAAAAMRLRDDAEYSGDEWTIENVGTQNLNGTVSVTIAPDDEPPRRRTITVTADYPADDTDRVRTSRTLTITLPDSEPAPTN